MPVRTGFGCMRAAANFLGLGIAVVVIGSVLPLLRPSLCAEEAFGIRCIGYCLLAAAALLFLCGKFRRWLYLNAARTGSEVKARLVLIYHDHIPCREDGSHPYIAVCEYYWDGKRYLATSPTLKRRPELYCSPIVYVSRHSPKHGFLDIDTLYNKE